jgi:transaldolase
MSDRSYLQWLSAKTQTAWWHDSGDPQELQRGLENGAVGVTTNPILSAQALHKNKGFWRQEITHAIESEKEPRARAEALMKIVVLNAAKRVEPIFRSTFGAHGYACAQVDPSRAGDREAMYDQARRFNAWAPNIAIKLPATHAGIDVMEKCCAQGMTVVMTVSFTVAQVCAIAARHQHVVRSRGPNVKTGGCFAVIMIGRLDDYLREVLADNAEPITEAELRMAGVSIVKHAYELYRNNGFEAKLLVAALRGNYHMVGLAGGDLTMSIHPAYQTTLLEEEVEKREMINEPIPHAVLEKLYRIAEFRKAYDQDGLSEKEMVTFGLTQRTLAQFVEAGWKQLEQFKV